MMDLSVGDKVILVGKANRKERNQKRTIGTIISEYEHHYLLQVGQYRTCVLKADIKTGQAKLERVG